MWTFLCIYLVFVSFEKIVAQSSPNDPHSFARPDLVKVTNVHLDLEVDFSQKILNGSVTLRVEKVYENASVLMLDVKDLVVFGVADEESGQALTFQIGYEHRLGSRLDIELPKGDCRQRKYTITIYYATTPDSESLHWLETFETQDQLLPFVFSQNEPERCRSMVPVQDTPSNKITYTAELVAPKEFTVLMSALKIKSKDECGKKRRHYFVQNRPVGTYLIAIAAGKLESKTIGPRSRVWAEPSFLDTAAKEFSHAELVLGAAEYLVGPYEWDVYDILVVTDFPFFGGMENPCLTFISPFAVTTIEEDIVRHEVAHSWAGNLVTAKNFNHLWINEGIASYLELKINAIINGPHNNQGMLRLHWTQLETEVMKMGPNSPLTALVMDCDDPIEAFSLVPYKKGAIFMQYLEYLVGEDEMLLFLHNFIQTLKYQSIDSYDFKDYFMDFFQDFDVVHKIDWNRWLHGTGMPTYARSKM